jgi:hypothetical protein
MGVFFTALAIFISVIGKTPTNSALLAFFAYAVLQIINISSDLALYSPAGASTIVNGIIAGTIDMGDLWLPILSALLFSMILFWSSQLFFKKQEI